jgi:trk system potassium uptake protein TrkH
MFIGGSPGSTAGGIKTIAFGLIIVTAFNTIRNKNRVVVYERTIPTQTLNNALSVTVVAFVLCAAGSLIISLNEELSYVDILFETVSAMGTVGLSTGITATLSPISHIVLIILMFLGRVGIMTIGIASMMNQFRQPKIQYPEARVLL